LGENTLLGGKGFVSIIYFIFIYYNK